MLGPLCACRPHLTVKSMKRILFLSLLLFFLFIYFFCVAFSWFLFKNLFTWHMWAQGMGCCCCCSECLDMCLVCESHSHHRQQQRRQQQLPPTRISPSIFTSSRYNGVLLIKFSWGCRVGISFGRFLLLKWIKIKGAIGGKLQTRL